MPTVSTDVVSGTINWLLGASDDMDDADPQVISGGNIVIHDK
jgi:hypothetical protein